MDILVACHNEVTDPKLFKYLPPLFDTPVPLVADYVDPYSSGIRWSNYDAESKDIIWEQYCEIMWPFRKVADYYNYYPDHKSIFYDLFDTGWKILKPGGRIVLSFPKNFASIYGKPINIETALENFKSVLKYILSRHPWNYRIVRRENMPFIISEDGQQERYDEYIFFVKPVPRTKSNNRGVEMVSVTRKKRRKRRSRKYTAEGSG
jgi:SAM-dependent methyltransferase